MKAAVLDNPEWDFEEATSYAPEEARKLWNQMLSNGAEIVLSAMRDHAVFVIYGRDDGGEPTIELFTEVVQFVCPLRDLLAQTVEQARKGWRNFEEQPEQAKALIAMLRDAADKLEQTAPPK